jgi:hypothetical protein
MQKILYRHFPELYKREVIATRACGKTFSSKQNAMFTVSSFSDDGLRGFMRYLMSGNNLFFILNPSFFDGIREHRALIEFVRIASAKERSFDACPTFVGEFFVIWGRSKNIESCFRIIPESCKGKPQRLARL